LARGLAVLPAQVVPYALRKPVLGAVLTEVLRMPLARGELDFLQGAALRIRVTDLSIHWLLTVDEGCIRLLDRERPDTVCIRGDSLSLLQLATRKADSDTLFFQRSIRIEGDTELGLALKNTLDAIEWSELPAVVRWLLEWAGRWPAAGAAAGSGEAKAGVTRGADG
jgi:predicted lipid carrier protein YhbT